VTVNLLPDLSLEAPAIVCNGSEAALTVTDANHAATSYCFSWECPACDAHNPYYDGDGSLSRNGCYRNTEPVCGTANTWKAALHDPGAEVTVHVTARTAANCTSSASTTITVGSATPSLTLTAGSSLTYYTPEAPITPIAYTTSCGGATVTGLPPGVSASADGNTLTISGTSTDKSFHRYTVSTTGLAEPLTVEGILSWYVEVSPNVWVKPESSTVTCNTSTTTVAQCQAAHGSNWTTVDDSIAGAICQLSKEAGSPMYGKFNGACIWCHSGSNHAVNVSCNGEGCGYYVWCYTNNPEQGTGNN
jgi:hypothetical protein